ncbi:MAG: S41 family peptidase [bacterium]|nr:S41 family peptidase [bacterium]
MKHFKNLLEKINPLTQRLGAGVNPAHHIKRLRAGMNWGSVRNFLNKAMVVSGIVLATLVLVGAGFYSGNKYGSNTPKNIVISGVSNMEAGVKKDADFNIFWQAWDMLKSNHIKGADLKDQDMIYGAVEGLINSVDDPHTVFFKPDDSQKFVEDIQGEFGGIGAELGIKDDFIVVIAPLEDTPASRGGIKAGDKILEVDGKPLLKADVNAAVKKIRGEIGTTVVLTILSNGDKAPHDISLVRGTISIPTLKWEIKNDNIAYVQLFSFNEKAPYLFYKTALAIMLGDMKGMVLDLRNNPGGYLEVAVNLGGWFFEKGALIVSEKFRSGEEIKYTSNGTGAFKDMPIVVLVNKGSASASEILAGALRDNRNIKLIGETTYGKGTVQDMEALKDGSQIKMTIAKWVMPSGYIIEQNGLKPDIEVKITEKDIEAKKDPQLERALEEVQKMISENAK